jgi:hypothetical protein
MYFFATLVFVVLPQHTPSGQQSPSGQHDAFAADFVLVLAAGRHSAAHSGVQPGGQVGSSQQHEVLASVLVLAAGEAVRQLGGQTSEQPGGQVGSRQQSPAFVVRALARASPAHTPPAVSDTIATASIHDRLVIG